MNELVKHVNQALPLLIPQTPLLEEEKKNEEKKKKKEDNDDDNKNDDQLTQSLIYNIEFNKKLKNIDRKILNKLENCEETMLQPSSNKASNKVIYNHKTSLEKTKNQSNKQSVLKIDKANSIAKNLIETSGLKIKFYKNLRKLNRKFKPRKIQSTNSKIKFKSTKKTTKKQRKINEEGIINWQFERNAKRI